MRVAFPLALHGPRFPVQLPDGSRGMACAVTAHGMYVITSVPRLRKGEHLAMELAVPKSRLAVLAEGCVVSTFTLRRRTYVRVRFSALSLRTCDAPGLD